MCVEGQAHYEGRGWVYCYSAPPSPVAHSTGLADSTVPRHNLDGEREHDYPMREGQQQVLRATFPRIRDSVRVLLEVRMDALARKFHETHDMKVKDEIERLLKEYGRLKEPWVFVAK